MPKIKEWISWFIRYNPCKVCLSFSHKLWPKFGNRWISRIGSLRFWWISVQRKALMRTMCSREIFTKKCRQQQIFDSDIKGAWHYNHVTFTPIAKNFMSYCRLIYILSILSVRELQSRMVAPPKKTGSSHLNSSGKLPSIWGWSHYMWARWNVSFGYHFGLLAVCIKSYCLRSRPGSVNK